MDIDDQRVQMAGGAHTTGHGIGNVVILEVQEQRLPADRRPRAIGAVRGEELVAELHAAHQALELRCQLGGTRQVCRVQGDQDALAWLKVGHGVLWIPLLDGAASATL